MRPVQLRSPGRNDGVMIYTLPAEYKGTAINKVGLYPFYYDKHGAMKPVFRHPPITFAKDFALTVANELRRYLGVAGITEQAVAERVEKSAQQKDEDEIERLSKLVPF